jgi:hypothetical protein
MTNSTELAPGTTEYTIPEGCLVCESDLQVRVTDKGPRGVCASCGYIARPQIRLTHEGLKVSYASQGEA